MAILSVVLPGVAEDGENEHALEEGFPEQENEMELLKEPFIAPTLKLNWADCPAWIVSEGTSGTMEKSPPTVTGIVVECAGAPSVS